MTTFAKIQNILQSFHILNFYFYFFWKPLICWMSFLVKKLSIWSLNALKLIFYKKGAKNFVVAKFLADFVPENRCARQDKICKKSCHHEILVCFLRHFETLWVNIILEGQRRIWTKVIAIIVLLISWTKGNTGVNSPIDFLSGPVSDLIVF